MFVMAAHHVCHPDGLVLTVSVVLVTRRFAHHKNNLLSILFCESE